MTEQTHQESGQATSNQSPRVISVINQKGGVGKTTTTVNLTHGLSLLGYRVLAIDLDPQSHLAASFGIHQRGLTGLDQVLNGQLTLPEAVLEVRDNLDLIPAGQGLLDIERLQEGGSNRGTMFRNALSGHTADYDFVVIDCPPASGLLVVNALFATQEVVIPVTGDYLGLQGLSHLMATLKNFEKSLGRVFTQWIVLSRFHARRRLAQEVQERVITYFPGKVLQTVISEMAALAECPSFGKSIFEYRPKSRSALEYHYLIEDLLKGRTF